MCLRQTCADIDFFLLWPGVGQRTEDGGKFSHCHHKTEWTKWNEKKKLFYSQFSCACSFHKWEHLISVRSEPKQCRKKHMVSTDFLKNKLPKWKPYTLEWIGLPKNYSEYSSIFMKFCLFRTQSLVRIIHSHNNNNNNIRNPVAMLLWTKSTWRCFSVHCAFWWFPHEYENGMGWWRRSSLFFIDPL